MTRIPRGVRVGLVGVLVACVVAGVSGCGRSEKIVGGSATVAMAMPPDSLDPQVSYTTEGAEADWIAYTPLLTYRHKSGPDGADLIPGLALRLPRISPEGRHYRLTLRRGLVYSNGRPVKASDFEYTIERAIRLNWPGKKFLTDHIVGAESYDLGRADQISGITTDDARGKVFIKLVQPWGGFANVLALPGTGLVPSGTPMKDLSAKPPPGVGAYRIADVVPGKRWTMIRNTDFESLELPDIPPGNLERIDVRVAPDPP